MSIVDGIYDTFTWCFIKPPFQKRKTKLFEIMFKVKKRESKYGTKVVNEPEKKEQT